MPKMSDKRTCKKCFIFLSKDGEFIMRCTSQRMLPPSCRHALPGDRLRLRAEGQLICLIRDTPFRVMDKMEFAEARKTPVLYGCLSHHLSDHLLQLPFWKLLFSFLRLERKPSLATSREVVDKMFQFLFTSGVGESEGRE
eukprot:XP_016865046.1 COMM domain-containing protein 10 isoform X5 [Homo sapiens]